MAELVVRPALMSDLERWLPLWQGYNRFYEREVADEITALTWSRFFDVYEPMHVHVAEMGDALIGFVHFIYHRNTTMRGPVCYLQDLFAAESARGTGIGRALIESVYDAARLAGSPRVYWQTHETNMVAQQLYDRVAEKSGFIVYRQQM